MYLAIGKVDLGTWKAAKQSAYYYEHFPREAKPFDFRRIGHGLSIRIGRRVFVVTFGFDCAYCRDRGEGCPECCEHEYDWDEGGMCLNCGDQECFGAVIDRTMARMEDR